MSVVKIRPDLKTVRCPAQLRGLKGWLIWFEVVDADGKARKIPHYANGKLRGAHGTPRDKGQLVTFDEAIQAAAKAGADGVGIAMMADWGVIGLDFDGVSEENRPQLLELLAHTYAEVSPSGKGIHAFVTGSLGGNRKSHAGGNRGWPFGFEVFESSGFLTFTGQALEGWDLTGADDLVGGVTPGIMQLVLERFGSERPAAAPREPGGLRYSDDQIRTMLASLDPDLGYNDWVAAGMAIHRHLDGDGFELWDEWSSAGSLYPGREELERKWDGFGRKEGSRQVDIGTLVKMSRERGGVSVGSPVASPEDFDVIEDGELQQLELEDEVRGARVSRFAVVRAYDMVQRARPGWLIKHILPWAELVVLFGPSGSGKSFVMLDMAMCIARGVPWRGKKTRGVRVVYICAEGRGGFRNRLKAYSMHHQVDLEDVPFGIIDTAPNFLMNEDVKAVEAAIKAADGAGLIVVDTFAKVTPGANENAGEDMGKAIDNCRKIHEATGALVVLVHHTGKDTTRGARGWSGIKGATDAQIEVGREGATSERWIKIDKEKDEDDSGRWGFKLGKVTIEIDEDDEPVTSCVVVEAEVPERVPGKAKAGGSRAKETRVGAWEAAILAAVSELSIGEELVTRHQVLGKAIELRPEVGGPMKKRKYNAGRALNKMIKTDVLGCEGDLIFQVED